MSPPAQSPPSPRTRAYVAWVLRHGRLIWLIALLVTIPAGWRTAKLYMSLHSDLESLLPGNAPSVVALDELRARTPGIKTLGVVVDTGNAGNLAAGEKFIDDLAARVRTYPPELVAGVRTGIAEERKFIEEHAALYADLADLETARKRIEERRDYEAAKAAEVDLEDEPPPPLDFSDIEKRYRQKQEASSGRFPNDRYSSTASHTTLMLVEIGGYSTGTARSRALLDRIRADAQALGGLDKYAPGMSLGFAGDPAINTEELSALEGDLAFSSLVVIALVALVLILYYQWWRSIPVIFLPLLIGVAATFAIASFLGVHHLNSNTAFLGSIIVGNGINFGIILLARYIEERRNGLSIEEALTLAVHSTRVGTVTAAAAAGIAYGSLIITQFRGFWQFGVIGGIGMLVCWGTTFLLIPPLLAWWDHGKGSSVHTRLRTGTFTGPLARLIERFPAPILAIGLALTLAAAIGSRSFGPERMETDFSKMRRADTWKTGEGYWGRRMDAVLGRYLTPVVILTDSGDQTRKLAAALREEMKNDPVLQELVDSVRTVDNILPSQQEQKLEQARAIRSIITPRIKSEIPADKRELIDRLLGAKLEPIADKQLPATFVMALREHDGTLDRAVLVYPRPTGATWKGNLLIAFAGKLRAVAARFPGPDGRVPRVAGSAPLSADITGSMGRDGPRATAVALAGVLVLILFAFRFSRETVLILAELFVGVLWLIGSTMFFDVKINFANFIGFPITFGIGVDYAVNVMWRYRLDGGRDVVGAVRSTGGAVGLCSITTIIGYSSLLLAQNQALFSFGMIAVMGEFTCLATAVVLLPATLLILDRRRRAAVSPSAAR